MSDEPVKGEPVKEDQLDHDFRRGRTWGVWESNGIKGLVILLLLMLCVLSGYGIWATKRWGESSNMGANAAANLNTFMVSATALVDSGNSLLKKAEAKIDAVDTTKLNTTVDEANGGLRELKNRVAELKTVEGQLASLAAGVQREMAATGKEVREQLHQEGTAVASLLNDTNASVNKQLLPEVTKTMAATRLLMEKFGLSSDEATQAIHQLAEKLGKTVEETTQLVIASRATIESTNATIIDLHTDIHGATKELPGIASDVHKTTTNISKFSKVSIVVSILSRLLDSLIPGLLH